MKLPEWLPRLVAALAALVGVLVLPRVSHAQIVNVLYQARDAPEGFSGRLVGSSKWLSGNTNQLTLEASALFRYRYERHLWLLVGSGAFGINQGERFINKDTVHLRYRVEIVGPLLLEAFVQNDRNPFRRRVTRTVFGGGPRVEVLSGPVMWMAFGLSYMPEHEQLSVGDFADSGASRWHHRVSGYASHEVALGERWRLAHTLFLQPAVDDLSNTRAYSELSLSIDIIQELAVQLSQSLQLDTEPPIDVRPADADRRLSLTYAF